MCIHQSEKATDRHHFNWKKKLSKARELERHFPLLLEIMSHSPAPVSFKLLRFNSARNLREPLRNRGEHVTCTSTVKKDYEK